MNTTTTKTHTESAGVRTEFHIDGGCRVRLRNVQFAISSPSSKQGGSCVTRSSPTVVFDSEGSVQSVALPLSGRQVTRIFKGRISPSIKRLPIREWSYSEPGCGTTYEYSVSDLARSQRGRVSSIMLDMVPVWSGAGWVSCGKCDGCRLITRIQFERHHGSAQRDYRFYDQLSDFSNSKKGNGAASVSSEAAINAALKGLGYALTDDQASAIHGVLVCKSESVADHSRSDLEETLRGYVAEEEQISGAISDTQTLIHTKCRQFSELFWPRKTLGAIPSHNEVMSRWGDIRDLHEKKRGQESDHRLARAVVAQAYHDLELHIHGEGGE